MRSSYEQAYRKGLFYLVSVKEKDDKTFDYQGHALRSEADQERHKCVAGSSPDRHDSTAHKEVLGRVLHYRISIQPQNAMVASYPSHDIPDLVDSIKRHEQKT